MKKLAFLVIGLFIVFTLFVFGVSRQYYRSDVHFQNYWLSDDFEIGTFHQYLHETILPTQWMKLKKHFGKYDSTTIDTLPTYSIRFSKRGEMNLKRQVKRKKWRKAKIEDNYWKYINAKFNDGVKDYKVKLRIKGDLEPNYERGTRHSNYRVKFLSEDSFLDDQRWSFVMPYTENGLYNFIYYKVFQEEGFIGPELNFVNFKINNVPPQLYFMQSGFTEALLTRNGVENSFIYKAKNDCAKQFYDKKCFLPKMKVYGNNWDKEDAEFQQMKHEVDSMIDLYQDGLLIVDDLFDYNAMAKFIVLSEFFISHHAQACHNLRFYWNPKKKRLQPMAWDPASFAQNPFQSDSNRTMDGYNNQWNLPLYRMILDTEKFKRKKEKWIKYYTEEDRILKAIENQYKQWKDFEPFMEFRETHLFNMERVKRNYLRMKNVE